MTPIGIIRKLDDLGRIVIPKEMLKFLQVKVKDELEILLTTDGILIRKQGYEVRKID